MMVSYFIPKPKWGIQQSGGLPPSSPWAPLIIVAELTTLLPSNWPLGDLPADYNCPPLVQLARWLRDWWYPWVPWDWLLLMDLPGIIAPKQGENIFYSRLNSKVCNLIILINICTLFLRVLEGQYYLNITILWKGQKWVHMCHLRVNKRATLPSKFGKGRGEGGEADLPPPLRE